MVKINKIEEPESFLYVGGERVGTITSFLQLNDVRLQIKKAKISGYYIVWLNETIRIDKFGNLEEWPKGFYDTIDTQLWELTDW